MSLFYYVVNQAEAVGKIYGYSVDDTTGILTPLSPTPSFSEPHGSGKKSIAKHPTKPWLYSGGTVIGSASGFIEQYSIDPGTGFLTDLGSNGDLSNPSYSIAITPNGKWLYSTISGFHSGPITVQHINQTTGALESPSVVYNIAWGETNAEIRSIRISSDGYLYVNSSGRNMWSFGINDFDGSLTRKSGPTGDNGFYDFDVSPDGKWIYGCPSPGSSRDVYLFPSVAGVLSGRITAGDISFSWRDESVAVSPNGSWLYIVSLNDGGLNKFNINPSDGSLGSKVISGRNGGGWTGFLVTPDNKFSYLIDDGGPIERFSIASGTGELTHLMPDTTVSGTLNNGGRALFFDNGPTPSPTFSTISALPTSVVANGTSSSTVTITLKDSSDVAIPGETVVFSSTGTGNILTQPVSVTDAFGQATGVIKSTVAELKTLSITSPLGLGTDTFPMTFVAVPDGTTMLASASGFSFTLSAMTSQDLLMAITPANIFAIPVIAADIYFGVQSNVKVVVFKWRHSSGREELSTFFNDGSNIFRQVASVRFSPEAPAGSWILSNITLIDWNDVSFVVRSDTDLPSGLTITTT